MATQAARRRAHALAEAGAIDAPSILERWVAGLWLADPWSGSGARRLARLLPATVVTMLAVSALVGGAVLALVVAMILVVLARWLTRGSPRRRGAAIDRDLPSVLEAVARHLRAGGSLAQAIVAARPAAPMALAETWTRLQIDVDMVGVVSALDRWGNGSAAAASPRPSERLASAALALAAETGGSPARAVDGVAATLRARRALGEEIRALSSQARASAAVIALAPLAFGVLAGATDDRTSTFFRTTGGLVLLAMGLGLDVLGAWWMARLCRMSAS